MILKRAECLSRFGSDYMIQKKINAGELFRVGKAVYSDEPHVPELAVLAFMYPQAVVAMRNAFYIYGFTDVIPDKYDFATDRDASKIRDQRIVQYYCPNELFHHGITTFDYKGFQIHIYSKERMLIELLRYKSKLPFDYYKEVLQHYRKNLSNLDIQAIQDYALTAPKSGKIMELLQMEVL